MNVKEMAEEIAKQSKLTLDKYYDLTASESIRSPNHSLATDIYYPHEKEILLTDFNYKILRMIFDGEAKDFKFKMSITLDFKHDGFVCKKGDITLYFIRAYFFHPYNELPVFPQVHKFLKSFKEFSDEDSLIVFIKNKLYFCNQLDGEWISDDLFGYLSTFKDFKNTEIAAPIKNHCDSINKINLYKREDFF